MPQSTSQKEARQLERKQDDQESFNTAVGWAVSEAAACNCDALNERARFLLILIGIVLAPLAALILAPRFLKRESL